MNEKAFKKLSQIKIVVSDVDGILTDGTISVSKNQEFKTFHVEDALGTSLLKLADIPISFISARVSEATTARLDELKIKHYFQGYINKVSALDKIIEIYNLDYQDVLYIGDGFVDIPVMEKVGFSISVPNAHLEVKEYADFITKKSGGEGVLVEIAQYLLKSKGIYERVFEKMRNEIYNA
ncbi:HAD hydrolase family protein [bacterium]|nr:HAD hydrolase family protein [bacterium]|tara:strand:- start:103 stop:642 length:540 start_codon:yes stop_codon:yes gene_type:complete